MTSRETGTTPRWQTFDVARGVVSRNESGQLEGILVLADGVALVFRCDCDPAFRTWLPEEPNFRPDLLADDERSD